MYRHRIDESGVMCVPSVSYLKRRAYVLLIEAIETDRTFIINGGFVVEYDAKRKYFSLSYPIASFCTYNKKRKS